MILLFYAFAREIAAFRRRLENRAPLTLRGFNAFRGTLGNKAFAVVGHGIGLAMARDNARRAFDSIADVELVIGTGVVGALTSGLKPGDLVLADRILATRAGSDSAEHVMTVADTHLREIGRSMRQAGLSYSTGANLTADRVFATVAEKLRANKATGAIAVDMETAALAAEANARGLPFVMLRAVLDEVDDEVPGADAMSDEHGRVRPLAATSYLMRNPATILKIPRLMRNLARASNSLADALEAIAYDGILPDAVKTARAAGRRRQR
jgi:nucleoside phosphorylase